MRATDIAVDPVRFWPHDTRAKWAVFTLATSRWIAEQRRGH